MSVEINATNFPNEIFRNLVSLLDTDENGVLENSDLLLSSLTIWSSPSYTSIEYTLNSGSLRVNIPTTDAETITSLKGIEYLIVNRIALGSLPNITDIGLSQEQWERLDDIHITGLSGIKTIDLSNSPNLRIITIEEMSITNFVLGRKPSLQNFYIRSKGIPDINLGTLDLSESPDLQRLVISGRKNSIINIQSIALSNICMKLLEVSILDTTLSEIHISSCPLLFALHLAGCSSLPSVDISRCQRIKDVYKSSPPEPGYSTYNSDYLRYGGFKYSDFQTSGDHPELSVDQNTIVIANDIDLAILDQTTYVKGRVGDEKTLFVLADSSEEISYQWEIRPGPNHVGYTPIDGETGNTCLIVLSDSNATATYRCSITSGNNALYTEIIPVILVTLPVITVQPRSISVIDGQLATFSISTTGVDIVYQWQVYTDGNWENISLATNDTYQFTASDFLNGQKYRCVVSNEIGEVISDEAVLTIVEDTSISAPIITTQPLIARVLEGQLATFSVIASGKSLAYQWYSKKLEDDWALINGATESSYSVIATFQMNGLQFRCTISNSAGSVVSNAVALIVKGTESSEEITVPSIIYQPVGAAIIEGYSVSFNVTAVGGSLTYQWQKKTGNTWYTVASLSVGTLLLENVSKQMAGQYRCIISNAAGSVTSASVTLVVGSEEYVSSSGYHSIIISGVNTFERWHMYPTSRPHVAPAEVKTSYVDIPGGNGGLDYTELLAGAPCYGYRKGSWEFMLIPGEKWADVYRSLCSYLHGKSHTVVLEDDPQYKYTGRLQVNKWESAAHNSLITIDYILDPDPINLNPEEYDSSQENTESSDMEAVFRILSKPENAGKIAKKYGSNVLIISPEILFDDGDSIYY